MTDLPTLRAGCQRGEMPTWDALSGADGRIRINLFHSREYDDGLYKETLAALQEGLWQGSVMVLDHEMQGDDVVYRIALALPTRPQWTTLAQGEFCPTFDCAWADAIFAGLMEGAPSEWLRTDSDTEDRRKSRDG